MARSADAPAINWEIANNEVLQSAEIGNGSNRFDAWRQSDTLGPQPPTAETGPPETNGEPGTPPSAADPAI